MSLADDFGTGRLADALRGWRAALDKLEATVHEPRRGLRAVDSPATEPVTPAPERLADVIPLRRP